jgi:hypothetical protein
MGADQLMMGNNELAGLGFVTSPCDNDSCLAKSLIAIVWHSSTAFSTTLY